MRRIGSKNTKPELAVRSLLHRMGLRFRLHVASLPGCPDIVLPRWRTVLFVHGCFWHQHPRCAEGRIPQSRREYWQPKLQRNCERDRAALRALRKLGWRVLVVWECEIKNSDRLRRRLQRLLQVPAPSA